MSAERAHVSIRQLTLKDLDELTQLEIATWGEDMCASKEMLASRIQVFPEGMIGAVENGKICGYICLMTVNSQMCEKDFTWMGITDGGFIRATHDPNGDCFYGVSLSVLPTASKDVAVKLIKAAAKLSIRKALKGVLFGGRLPSYHKYAGKKTVDEYLKSLTKKGRIIDPEQSFYRQVNALAIRPLPNYFDDPQSLNYGFLGFFENPLYKVQKFEFPFFFKNIKVDFT